MTVLPMPADDDEVGAVDPNAVQALSRDLRAMAAQMDADEARDLVDLYYRIQKARIAAGNQRSALEGAGRPAGLTSHFHDQLGVLERQLPPALKVYAQAHAVGRWSMDQKGIGPVLAAGLLAHIDITRARTAGAVWSFAGLNPEAHWERGQRRPWNARLKTLCWKIGESFAKVQRFDDAFYAHFYAEAKADQVARNEAGEFRDQAEASLASGRNLTANQRVYYDEGKLPPGRVDLRAKRKAMKLFLAHWHHVAYVDHYGTPPPAPYPIAHLGHAHEIPVPPGGDL